MSEVAPSARNHHWHRPGRTKKCALCEEAKGLEEFSAYAYQTRQGKTGVRYESRCRDCSRKRASAYRQANPAVTAEQNRRRVERDPDMHKKLSKRYRETAEGKRIKAKLQRLRKARMRSGEGDDPAIRAVYEEAMRVEVLVANCPVFDLPELGKKMHVDHVRPLARGGRHEASNLQVLPAGLNMRKGASCPRSPQRGT